MNFVNTWYVTALDIQCKSYNVGPTHFYHISYSK